MVPSGKGSKEDCKNVKWSPPAHGSFKLNFDGATKGNLGKFGGGCIIMDWVGEIVGRLVFPLPLGTNN